MLSQPWRLFAVIVCSNSHIGYNSGDNAVVLCTVQPP